MMPRIALMPRETGSPKGADASLATKAAAWLVHFYTSLGLAVAAGIVVAILQGTPRSYLWAFAGMWTAMVIDATDGTMARRVHVKDVLPGFDGRRLDDLIDFLTYTCLPLLLIWQARILPPGKEPWLLFPLLASAYGFCQVEVKTDDGFFLGFPSYWNIVALYLYFLRPSPGLSLGVLLALAALTFVPTRYLYPSQKGTPLSSVTNWLGAGWAVMWALILIVLLRGKEGTQGFVKGAIWLSFFYPAYYFVVSWAISIQRWLGGTRA